MTVPVSVQQRIRVLDAHGMSWRSIAKEVGVARDTVAKYAGREDCSPGPERSVSRPSKLDPFRATVDGWLQADRFMLFCFNVCSTGSAVFFRSVG
ncbi:hypothetical protein [Bifidobacterium longum]|uniref:hypothetical protein n=1 Tax=Bifidobacterium longum TaxID=216816 RepID=UPI0010EA7FFF|nr:hypothetical protein [Bifidobacterium longum]TCE13654.1 Transposase [Bifidobacterium longum subsp. longum]